MFKIPLWRHVFTWVGARPASVSEFKRLLAMGSVGLIPGVSQGQLCVRGGGSVSECRRLLAPPPCLPPSTHTPQTPTPVSPGDARQGIAEMFLSEAPRADVVKLLGRKGFVRVAVEAGVPLVPIYVRAPAPCALRLCCWGHACFCSCCRAARPADAPTPPPPPRSTLAPGTSAAGPRPRRGRRCPASGA